MNRIFRFFVTALIISVICGSIQVFSQQKIKITKADELPRRSVQLKGKALEILEDRAQLDNLTDQIIKSLQGDLEKYEIVDNSTLQGYYLALMQLYAAKGEFDRALYYLPLARSLETKPAGKLTTGLTLETWIKTKRQVEDSTSEEFKKAFERNYAEAYAKLPYSEIAESVEALKGALALQNKELVFGGIESGLQPVLDNLKNNAPEGLALQLVALRFDLDNNFPLRDQRMRVLTALYEANNKKITRENIWAAREVDISSAKSLNPVVVAVWDSGTDMDALPAENRFVNNRETINGKDEDGNGYVDDRHGIGYDLIKFEKSIGTLDNPAGKIKSDTKMLQKLVKGSLDLEAAIQSEEAVELQKTIASLKREQVKEFMEELSFYGNYSHGTHVAGIIVKGNPAARIMGARMSWDFRLLPQVSTIEQSKFKAQMYRDTIEYFKKQNVRVVNMSWRYNSANIEGALTANGVGKTEDERKKIARELFEIEKQALYEAIKNAPEILFVAASGNENNDADFSEYIPASFNLPNLITIGAVDSAGRKTSFTTEGESVDFYANGYEVESFVPGGDRLKFSGTSMAAPNVANLAAKIFAVNPKLKPAEVIKQIGGGSEASAEDNKIRLINPKKTFALLKD